ncbi:MAG: cupin domain-containing protein [Sulfolobales archaeon]
MIVNTRNLPEYKVPKPYERSLKVVLDPRLGNYDKATVLSVTIEPGSTTGLHQHVSDEIIYVISGKGTSVLVDGDNVVELEVGEGYLVLARAGVKHEMRNTGSEPLKLYCVFIPPLPVEGYFAEALRVATKRS